MINILIVEDDPMVAQFNQKYVEDIDGFSVAGIAHSVKDALSQLEEVHVDLILLDIFMPGQNGLELLTYIRQEQKEVDVIAITAASDMKTIQQVLRNGAIEYLIKPFTFSRFQQALVTYKNKFYTMKSQSRMNQQEVDELFTSHSSDEIESETLPKGLTTGTLEVVIQKIEEMNGEAFSTDDIAEKSGISRVSVRKYLKFLTDIGVLGERMTYGTIGRPVYAYIYNEKQKHVLSNYLS
ncbi:response regulator [Priestia flexa]|jgi:two-component system, CitB family, response regulator MalR|uniref:Response regulator n=1 Tax=Priestia flexa TaxID=86664 RepID=A0A8I1MGL9_9BACI|nr:response regulator [Priestia flexa]MBN8252732.1 response regulator [Priestia flexa]MBN8435899.1 response regulator [Priestia flexa]MCA0968456.1 response regulator [Priestia flexa]UIR30300.1 response regulator [Priestia flexa]UZW66728.1 response regulator [Priestia flexa]